ncbi:hypothetical protein [Streptomyces sp. NPDC057301]|uniref:hypothetical protein n=1 Tax=Streptomyces sp. NPDC057301 TaxID=3346093 RepID=UPI003635F753
MLAVMIGAAVFDVEGPVTSPYTLTVIEEHRAQPGLTDFVENVHLMISSIAADLSVPSRS